MATASFGAMWLHNGLSLLVGNGGGSPPSVPSGDAALLESGMGYVLLEAGDFLLLE